MSVVFLFISVVVVRLVNAVCRGRSGKRDCTCCDGVELVVVLDPSEQLSEKRCEFRFLAECGGVKVQQKKVVEVADAAYCDVHLAAGEEFVIADDGNAAKCGSLDFVDGDGERQHNGELSPAYGEVAIVQ